MVFLLNVLIIYKHGYNYYTSKKFYLTREMTYSYFLTIIRQLCKVCNILFTYKIKYISSKYMIEYYIYEL